SDGLVQPSDLPAVSFDDDAVDYGRVTAFKADLVRLAWERFGSGHGKALRPLFEEFCQRQRHWLDDYALFGALKDTLNDAWQSGPRPLALRQPEALRQERQEHSDAVGRHQFAQFLFFRQW